MLLKFKSSLVMKLLFLVSRPIGLHIGVFFRGNTRSGPLFFRKGTDPHFLASSEPNKNTSAWQNSHVGLIVKNNLIVNAIYICCMVTLVRLKPNIFLFRSCCFCTKGGCQRVEFCFRNALKLTLRASSNKFPGYTRTHLKMEKERG